MKLNYLFLIFFNILFFNLSSVHDSSRIEKLKKVKKNLENIKKSPSAIVGISSTDKFGFAHLSSVRNKTKWPLKVSASKFLTKNGRYKKKVYIEANETKLLNLDVPIDGSYVRIEGFGQSNVNGLFKGSSIKINAGYAWLDKTFEKNNEAMIVFGVKAYKNLKTQDTGRIEIVLGSKISGIFDYKIVIGADKNNTSYILKKDKKTGKNKTVYKIETKNNPFAKIRPGMFERYWVSINKGLILVGKDQPGQNIFMSFYDYDFTNNIYRFGLGAGQNPIDYTAIQLAPPLVTKKKWLPYFKHNGEPEIKVSKGNFQVLKTPFKVPGSGCFSFEAKGNSGISVAFGDNFEYQFLIGADANSRTLFLRNGRIVASIMSDENPEIVLRNPGKFNRYWISVNDGLILFGKGTTGQNLMFAWNDEDPIKISNQIGIGIPITTFKIEGKPDCKNIQLGSPVRLSIDFEKIYYKKEKKLFAYPDSFTVIKPIKYQLFQDRKIVGIKDLILGKRYTLAKVEQDQAKYYLMLIIDEDGTPKIQKVRGAEPSQEMVDTARIAFILKTASQEALRVGEEISYGAGRGPGGMMIAIGSEIIMSAGKSGSGQAAEFEGKTKFGYQMPEKYGFVETVQRPSIASYKPSAEAIKNKKKVNDLIEKTRLKQESGVTLATYSYILNLINDFYIVDDYSKKKIQNAVEFLFNNGLSKLQDDEYYKKLLKLLLDVRDNPYIVDANNAEDIALKRQWHSWANQIALYLLQKNNKTKDGVKIPGTFGEFFWIPVELPKQGKGKISFSAKALHDIYICFSPEKSLMRNSDIPFYEIVIRGWKGTKSAIRTTSLGRSVAEFYHIRPMKTDKGLEFALDPESLKVLSKNYKFRKYIVSVNDGRIVVLEDGKKILDWTDHYPIKNVKYIGIGSWDVNVNFKNIAVGKALK